MVIKIKLLLMLSFFVVLLFPAVLAEPISCDYNGEINIYSNVLFDIFDSACIDENVLLYPSCSGGGVEFNFVSCEDGCFNDRCNLGFDDNSDSEISLEELVKAGDEYTNGNIEEINFLSLITNWLNN